MLPDKTRGEYRQAHRAENYKPGRRGGEGGGKGEGKGRGAGGEADRNLARKVGLRHPNKIQ